MAASECAMEQWGNTAVSLVEKPVLVKREKVRVGRVVRG